MIPFLNLAIATNEFVGGASHALNKIVIAIPNFGVATTKFESTFRWRTSYVAIKGEDDSHLTNSTDDVFATHDISALQILVLVS